MPRMLSLLASAFIGASIYAIGAQVGLEFLGLGDISTVHGEQIFIGLVMILHYLQNLGGHLCLQD